MQGREIAARRPNGLGVGLAICRSIIKARGERAADGDSKRREAALPAAILSVCQELDDICARVLINTLNSATWSSSAAMHTQHPSWVNSRHCRALRAYRFLGLVRRDSTGAGLFGRSTADVNGTLTASLGPFIAGRPLNIDSGVTGFGDLYPQAYLK